ncbi:hypothetical protein TNCV_4361601 [Trichonephila clavipes]|nr:hypothetical protein TNCV_4361601 [Trichonephila clavipes]
MYFCHPSGIVVSDAYCFAVGLGTGEDMDVSKCIGPPPHWSTLNSRRPASSLVRFVEEVDRWEDPDQPQGVLPLKLR